MILAGNNTAVLILDVIFLIYGFIRVMFTYLILAEALKRKDARGYKFVALSFVIPIIAFVLYRRILKTEESSRGE